MQEIYARELGNTKYLKIFLFYFHLCQSILPVYELSHLHRVYSPLTFTVIDPKIVKYSHLVFVMIFFALNCYILSDSGHLCNSGNVSMLIICKMLIVCKWEFEISAGEDILLNYRTVESSESYLDNTISLNSVQAPRRFHIINCMVHLLARLISILLFQLADSCLLLDLIELKFLLTLMLVF